MCAEGNGTPNGETAMATAHAKHHDYHLVDPSPWPVVGSISAFIMAVGAISWMHHMFAAAPVIFGAGTIGVLYTMASWWGDVIREAQYKGDHTRVVQISHRYGMILFIASRSEEHTSELQSRGHLVCRLLLEKKKQSSRRSLCDIQHVLKE